MQICLGATYAWSVFVHPIRQITGLMQGPVQLPFTIFYFVFPATVMVSGRLLRRWGPRGCACLGGLCFGGGWLLASLGRLDFIFTVLGIGALAGVGAGMAYIVPITVGVQWFPRHKGLVTGIAVAGFGGGAALVGQAAGRLMSRTGLLPFHLFALFGVLFLVGIGLSGLMMQSPPTFKTDSERPLPLKSVWNSFSFKILYLAMFTGLAAGFAVNANLKELYAHGTVKGGLWAVSVFAMANAGGRILWGWLFDRMHSATAIAINLTAQALVLFCSHWVLNSNTGLILFAAATGLNYGGVLVIFAAGVARVWGAERMGQVYSLLFSANIPAALSPILAGLIYDHAGSFTIALALIALMLIVAVFVILTLRNIINTEKKH